MNRTLVSLLAVFLFISVRGQMVDPVHFMSQLKMGDGSEAEIVFTATIDDGWHVYSTDMGDDGPISATFNVVKIEGVELVGKLTPRGNVVKQFDNMFGMELRFFEKKATFVQRVRFTKPHYTIDCFLEYGACNDEMCLPPSQVELKKAGTIDAALLKAAPSPPAASEVPVASEPPAASEVPVASEVPSASEVPVAPEAPVASAVSAAPAASASLWQPVVAELTAMGGGDTIASSSLLYILFMGFVGGLLAVLMPCIWPIIPMTVSFFLKRSKSNKAKGIRDAMTYGASIVVIYLAMGLLVTAIFGSDTLNAMSTNAVFNVFLFLLLVVFALSFFGWFEIKLPDSWANKVDAKADSLSVHSSGFTSNLSIFLMAFTLVLVSFSCTAPIIGLLLVETTTSGNWLAPAVGMFGFAVALALPFTLFALFPSWLKQAPKSGSWMNTLKVVLGFIELAFALKFLSVADLAYGWHILDREVFLSLWIVIFALLGTYLCGWLKFHSDMEGIDCQQPTANSQHPAFVMGGLVSLAFAVYMVPGLWGAPCKAVSAFAPPMNTQDFNLNTKVVEARFTDYEAGMAAARAEGKPVFVDFTGFGCVNCRKMEAAVWTDPRVADILSHDYVLISLFVDDKTPLKEPYVVNDEKGNTKTLTTVGAKWSYLQSHKFGANAQPFYVILDNEGKPLCGSRAYNEDVAAFLEFLKKGKENYTLPK